MTRLLIDKNALPESLSAATKGIQASPESARLYLAKSEILEKQDQFYEARRTLRTAAPTLPDPFVLARLAEMEDAGGQHAARYYRQLAEQQEKIDEKPSIAASDHNQTLERGLSAALRDNDLDTAAWFKARLPGAKAASSSGLAATVIIPGGLDALGFVARIKNSSPERFLVEYARVAAKVLQYTDKKTVEAYTSAITDQFTRIAELSALGSPGKDRVTVTISASARDKKKTEKVLELLGWKMRTARQGVKLEAAEKGDRARGSSVRFQAGKASSADRSQNSLRKCRSRLPRQVKTRSPTRGKVAPRADLYNKPPSGYERGGRIATPERGATLRRASDSFRLENSHSASARRSGGSRETALHSGGMPTKYSVSDHL